MLQNSVQEAFGFSQTPKAIRKKRLEHYREGQAVASTEMVPANKTPVLFRCSIFVSSNRKDDILIPTPTIASEVDRS